jgi:hypothetical protein
MRINRMKLAQSAHRPIIRLALSAVLAVFGLAFVLVQPCRGQQPSLPGIQRPPLSPQLGQPAGETGDDVPPGGSVDDEKQLRARNADRQKSLVSDTNKLLRLVKELNAEIARTNPDSLNADQLRRMAEIEKLARNVKDKMSTSVRGMPGFLPPAQPPR